MRQKFGKTSECNYQQSLDWHLLQYHEHGGLQRLISDLNKLYGTHTFLRLENLHAMVLNGFAALITKILSYLLFVPGIAAVKIASLFAI